jgi:hypothetical protein
MKTVFVLGAGTSHAAGTPLMAGFLKTAKDLHAANRFGVSGPQNQNVLDAAYKDLKPVLAKAKFTNLTNIEELFSAIDIGDLIGSFGNRPPASIAELRTGSIDGTDSGLQSLREFTFRWRADVPFLQFGAHVRNIGFRYAEEPADSTVGKGGAKIEMELSARRKNHRATIV